MEASLAALFRGFHQSLVAQVLEVLFDPGMLRPRQSTLGQINRDPGQVGRSVLANFRSGIAIVAAKLLLLFHGADRGIYLQRHAKFFVIRLAHVLEKLIAPRTAVFLVGLERWV